MLKVLIVDDEEIIREGMRTFPWQEHDCQIVGLAEDAEEAILLTRLHDPDIVISDIRMPGMDGLSLAQQLKQEFPFIAIILLTGFDETDYMRQALHLHVDDYLMKPANFQELAATIDRVSKTIRIRKNRESNYQRINQQIQAALPALQSGLFLQLINGQFESEEAAAGSLELFDIPSGSYVAIGARYQTVENTSAGSVKENWLLSLSIAETCQGIFSKYTSAMLTLNNQPTLFFLLIFSSAIREADCMNAIQLSTHKIKRTLQNDLGIDLNFGVSPMDTQLLHIPELYFQANQALTQCHFFNDCPTLYYNDIREATVSEFFVPEAKREIFFNGMRTGNKQAIEQYIDYLLDTASGTYPDISYYKHLLVSEIFCAVQTTQGPHFSKILEEGRYMDYASAILKCPTKRELKKQALETIFTLMSSQKNYATHYDSTAEKIIQFIKEHFAENLSLDILSEEFHFSPTYISRLIRRSQGVNFTEIVTSTRLSEAKRLLANPALKIEDIRRMVGYNDTSYFIQSFKQKYEMTPTEYRNMIVF